MPTALAARAAATRAAETPATETANIEKLLEQNRELAARLAKLEANQLKTGSYKDVVNAAETAVKAKVSEVANGLGIQEAAQTRVQEAMRNAFDHVARVQTREVVRELLDANRDAICQRFVTELGNYGTFHDGLAQHFAANSRFQAAVESRAADVAKQWLTNGIGQEAINTAFQNSLSTIIRHLASSSTLREGLAAQHREWAERQNFRLIPTSSS